VFLYGNDTQVGCWLFGILALWHLGYPERALNEARDMLALAQELAHPFTRVCALYFAAFLHQLRREAEAVKERTEPLLRIAREQGFALYVTWGTVLRGWALAEQGEIDKGIAQMRQGLATWRAMGAALPLPHFLSSLAQAYGRAGKVEEGLGTLSEALGLVEESGERCWEAELYRLMGDLLLLGRKGAAEAEACFHNALAVARRQGARSWELRAAVSLGRLWKEQAKREEARSLVQDVYGWFTEGSDTVDLKEAQTLLDALA
jgi:predicted ATPase